MSFEFAKILTKLGEAVVCDADLESGEDGFADLAGTRRVGCPVEQDFHDAKQAGVLDLDAGDFGVSRGDGRARRWNRGNSTWTSRAWARNLAKRSVTVAILNLRGVNDALHALEDLIGAWAMPMVLEPF
jgi:hypothetical protein